MAMAKTASEKMILRSSFLPASDLLSASFVMVTAFSDTLVQHSAV
jgi:hypothetical protein